MSSKAESAKIKENLKQCCGSEFFPSRIPDPGSKRFLDPGHGFASKLFLSSRKYDPKHSSRILDLDFLPIPDPGSKKAPRIRNTGLKGGCHENLKVPVWRRVPVVGALAACGGGAAAAAAPL